MVIGRVVWHPGGWYCRVAIKGQIRRVGQFGTRIRMSRNREKKIGRWLKRHYVKRDIMRPNFAKGG